MGGRTEERAATDVYISNLVGQLAGLASLADSRSQPARVGGGRGQAPVAINREERNEDGRILLGRNPKGATDQSVDVMRVDALNGKPVAVITSYAAHPVVMGHHTYLLSPDYPGGWSAESLSRLQEPPAFSSLGLLVTSQLCLSSRVIGESKNAWED